MIANSLQGGRVPFHIRFFPQSKGLLGPASVCHVVSTFARRAPRKQRGGEIARIAAQMRFLIGIPSGEDVSGRGDPYVYNIM